jgi:hypothetical protein
VFVKEAVVVVDLCLASSTWHWYFSGSTCLHAQNALLGYWLACRSWLMSFLVFDYCWLACSPTFPLFKKEFVENIRWH